MLLGKWRDYIYSKERDIRERLFVLVISVTEAALFVMLIEKLLTRSSMWDTASLGAGLFVTAAVAYLSVKSGRINAGAVIIAVIFCFILMPASFFYEGGIYGAAPLWFVFSALFASMLFTGRAKRVLLSCDCIAAGLCYFASYRFPDSIIQNDSAMAHIDSFVSLILIGTAISLTIGFGIKIYKEEFAESQKQKKEIELLSAAQNRFFSSMSHEIRTPINTIIGLNEMILRENISDEVAEDAANIQSASKLLLNVINDILDMSKFRSGQMQLNPEVYNTGDMLSDIVGMLWIRAKEKGLEFHVSVAPDLPAELVGDEVRIKQILINLINNAIKYTREGSVSLSLQCGTVSDGVMHVIYSVSDTGVGIKKENIPYLFDAFRRVDENENSHIEGTGLGLSIVKQFTELMGGQVTVNSVYTKGSSFIIDIPQKIAGEKLIGDIDLEKQHNIDRLSTYKKKFEAPSARVLVVDDVTSNLLVVKKLLRDTKVKIDTVSSGKDALKKTLNIRYDVIFMDHQMPEMDGIECMKKIRSQAGGQSKDAKITALTANAGAEARKLYDKEGFDGYIVKPVSGDALEKELYRLLPSDMVFVTGDVEDILEETISWMRTDQKKKQAVVTTESIADLPKELIDKYGIAAIPHMVRTEEGVFCDGTEIETHGLLEYMKDVTKSVATEVPDVRMHEAFFAQQLTGANNVIHVAVSSKLRNSGYPCALEASKAFDNVTVIDAGHLSSGQGIMVLEACRLAEEGKTPEEITKKLAAVSSRVRTSFIVDNLDFLARAGQVSKRVADITKSLTARPVLVMKGGKMGVGGVFFGTKENVWKKYIFTVLRNPSAIDRSELFVTYVGVTRQEQEWIRECIESRMRFDRIYFQQASPAVSVNCGTGTFGLLFKLKD